MTNQDYSDLERDSLEQLALQAVCAFQYYDLADCMNETTDYELQNIINGDYPCNCEECLNQRSQKN